MTLHVADAASIRCVGRITRRDCLSENSWAGITGLVARVRSGLLRLGGHVGLWGVLTLGPPDPLGGGLFLLGEFALPLGKCVLVFGDGLLLM